MPTHSHNFNGPWPFTDPDNTAVFSCEHVIERGRPILRVSHDHDGDWQFLCGDSHVGGKPQIVCLGCMVERDGSIVSVADLPMGWGADREFPGAAWIRAANPEPDEEVPDDA